MGNYVQDLGTMEFDNLIAGNEFPFKADVLTVKAAETATTLKKGTVLGVITASGLAAICDSSKSDGTETPLAVLAEDVVIPKDVNTKVTCYMTGVFNPEKLIFGGTDTAITHKLSLTKLNIYLKQMN